MKPMSIILIATALVFSSCRNLCGGSKCSDRGYCHEGDCICDKWITGEACESSYNADYDAVYEGSVSTINRSLHGIELTMIADENIPNRINIQELEVYFEFESDTSLHIPRQYYASNDSTEVFIEGTGRYTAESLYLEWWNVSEPSIIEFVFTGKRELNRVNND